MRQGIWITIVLILVLIIGVLTGYLIFEHKSHDSFSSKSRVLSSARPVFNVLTQHPFANDEWDEIDPFSQMQRMQKMMDRMMRYRRVDSASYNPAVDIKDIGKEYLIKVDLPGINKDKVSVKVENNQLTISGERQMEKEESEPDGSVYRSERSFGSFMQSIPLPADADSDNMKAESADGVLTIHIPKLTAVPSSAKKIEVSS